jgi:DNA-binding protein YbaB
MQDRLQKVQKELDSETVEASAGGGRSPWWPLEPRKLVSVRIDPEAAGDPEMLQDLIVAAVNEGDGKSKEMASTKMQSMAAGLGLPPGLV